MKIEDQVCSLDSAKSLKELGCVQESYFHWKIDGGEEYLVAHNTSYMHSKGEIIASAYTTAELGEMLIGGDIVTRIIGGIGGEWNAYCVNKFAKQPISQSANTEAESRALMLIHLIENGIVEVKK